MGYRSCEEWPECRDAKKYIEENYHWIWTIPMLILGFICICGVACCHVLCKKGERKRVSTVPATGLEFNQMRGHSAGMPIQVPGQITTVQERYVDMELSDTDKITDVSPPY